MKKSIFVIGLTIALLGSKIAITSAQTTNPLVFGNEAATVLTRVASRLDFSKLWRQDFKWGVLALNPDKAIYQPGETAFVSMGVLDEDGIQVCDASLDLEVWGPNGYYVAKHSWLINEIVVSLKECETKGHTDKPDFHTTVKLGGPGEYDVRLTARTKNGAKHVTDTWLVQEELPMFAIQRQGPTRTYPTATYLMRIDVLPQVDFKGTITEALPASFKVASMTPQGSVTVTPVRAELTPSPVDSTSLVWQVDWKKNQPYTLLYEFQPHGQSPDFFRAGPLQFSSEVTNYQEPRAWQIANDDTTDIDPTNDGFSFDWTANSCGGGGDYDCLDDGTRSPTAPSTTGDYLTGSNNNQHTMTYDGVPAGSTVTDTVHYVYHEEGARMQTRIAILQSDESTVICADFDLPARGAGSDQWDSSTCNGLSVAATTFNGGVMRHTCAKTAGGGGPTSCTAYAAYVTVTYDPPAGGGGPNHTQGYLMGLGMGGF